MADGPIREASVIVAPPDTCPNCGHERIWPLQPYPNSTSNTVTGRYRCPDCGFVWDTTWRIEPIMSTEYEDDGTTHTLACGCEFCEAIRREDESG